MLATQTRHVWVSGTRRSDGWWRPAKSSEASRPTAVIKTGSPIQNTVCSSAAVGTSDLRHLPIKWKWRESRKQSHVSYVSFKTQAWQGLKKTFETNSLWQNQPWIRLGRPDQMRLDVLWVRLPEGRAKTWLHRRGYGVNRLVNTYKHIK